MLQTDEKQIIDVMAAADIGSIDKLAVKAGIARASARKVALGQPVTIAVAQKAAAALGRPVREIFSVPATEFEETGS